MFLRVLCILLLGVLGAKASFFNKTQAAIEEVLLPRRCSTKCCTISTPAVKVNSHNFTSELYSHLKGAARDWCLLES